MKLRLDRVTKTFFSLRGSIVAVKQITLQVMDREFFVLLGPSGCGKSTVLNLVAGLERPSSGEIWFDNRLVASRSKKIFLSPKQRNVAMVFQSYALYPHLSVYENIAFPLRIAHASKETIQRSVEEAAVTLHISDLLKAKPGELSGGQRQRVAIARSIVRHPSLFLLDEPLSNLDAQLRLSMRTELKKLQRTLGITTLYVTHDQIEAMSLGTRIAVLKGGEVQQIGTPDQLYDNPVNPFVASFIGSPPMNMFKTQVLKENGMYTISVGGTKLELPKRKLKQVGMIGLEKCIAGIRPQDIYIDPPEEICPCIRARVDSIESSGRDLLLRVSTKHLEFSVFTQKTAYRAGDIITLGFDLSKLHLFKPKKED